MSSEFKLPELGENVASGTIAKLLVNEGESVQKDQAIMELETEKALFEVPSNVSGVIKQILVKEGEEVKVGQKILVLDDSTNGKEDRPAAQQAKVETREVVAKEEAAREKPIAEPVQTPPPKTTRATGPYEFKLPVLGENVDSGTVAKVLVAKGDAIKKDQAIVELETEKALFEVPSDIDGVVKDILIKEGEEVKVGQTIIVLEGGAEAEEQKAASASERKEEAPAVVKEAPTPEVAAPVEKPAEKVVAPPPEPAPLETRRAPGEVAPASPSVRRFAREIGIDINEVPGTGPGGRISIDDVKSYSKQIHQRRIGAQSRPFGMEPETLPDFSKWGEIERKPMSKVRETTAKHLSFAWATIPHVTQFDKADITELEQLRKQFGKKAEAAGGKLTVTAILLKIIEAAMKVFPQFNASIDMAGRAIVYKKYYHIGVAVDTDRGLLVPVVRDVDRKNLIQLSVELTQLAEKARNKKLTLEDMQGANFSISNLGGIGGTGFTPIINSPEVAILGVSRAAMEPVYLNGNFEPRLMLPISLSYDHRLIDGADAARFLRWVAEALEEPFKIMLEG